KSSSDDFLQIDLGTPHIVCGVATQGNHPQDQWVISFKFTYSTDGTTYSFYKDLAGNQVLFANQDRDGVVHQVLYKELVARYVRIHPTTFQGKPCMRGELYGVKTITVDLGSRKTVTGIATHGDHTRDNWVKKYKVLHSHDNKLWMETQSAVSYVLFANQDRDGVVHQVLYKELVARYVRIHPTTFQGKACMRGELYGVKTITGKHTPCTAPFGLENNTIPDDQISSNSSESSHPASQGRLYGASSWCSVTSSSGNLQVDLGSRKTVTGIATQGDHTRDNWVTKYKV
ncbi:predicted protein, partial [Nematostella vectensis]